MRERYPGQLNLVKELSSLMLVACPECGATAEVEWQATGGTTAQGLIAMVKIRCLNRHWFLLPREGLVPA